jgi:hypothetical protein
MIQYKILFFPVMAHPPAVVANAREPAKQLQTTRALADSRKLGKQSILLKKVIRLLTNLRFFEPHSRVSQARLTESRKLD